MEGRREIEVVTERNAGGGVRTEPRRRDAEVLDAAAKVFHEHGYADASVRDVADELGILKGSLYHYIDSKEDLLFRLLMEVHAKVAEIRAAVEAEADLTPIQRLHRYVFRHVIYTAEHLPRVSVYHHDVEQLSEDRKKKILRERHDHERYVEGLIREAQEAGEAEAGLDPTPNTRFIFGAFIWTYRWYQPAGRLSIETIAQECADFIVRGVGGDPSGVPALADES